MQTGIVACRYWRELSDGSGLQGGQQAANLAQRQGTFSYGAENAIQDRATQRRVCADTSSCDELADGSGLQGGVSLTPEAVKAKIGDRLRLAQHTQRFTDVSAAESLEADLALDDAPVTICAEVLHK